MHTSKFEPNTFVVSNKGFFSFFGRLICMFFDHNYKKDGKTNAYANKIIVMYKCM
jgi:hypothetical protein